MTGLIFKTILAMSAAGGILFLLILMLRPVTARVFPAAWNYYASLLVVIFLLIPVGFVPGSILADMPAGLAINATGTSILFADKMQDDTSAVVSDLDPHQARTKHVFNVDHIGNHLFWVWLLGMLIFITSKSIQFQKFKRKLRETSIPVDEGSSIYQIYQECRSSMGISQNITLLCNDSIKTPMVTGLLQTCLIMPKVDMDIRELGFIFHHELTHCRRKDLWLKSAAVLANAVHWFNPLVYRMVCDIDEFCEISCDEAVIRGMSMKDRHFYGETILNVLSRVINKQEGIYSSLCKSEKGIKRRLMFIMGKKNFSNKMIAASIAFLGFMFVAGSALAYVLVPSDGTLAESDWKTSLDKIDSKALFADIVADNKLETKNADEYQLALEQFLLTIAQNQKEDQAVQSLTAPIPGGIKFAPYGERIHPVTGERRVHLGTDYAQKQGSDILAANDGKVMATQKELGLNQYGKYVIIVHNDGTASLYAHCSTLTANTGDWVKKGDKIAEVGSTGSATGPHCHFELRIKGKPVDPIPYFAKAE